MPTHKQTAAYQRKSRYMVNPAERLGGCTNPLLAEIDRAMHELWLARSNRGD